MTQKPNILTLSTDLALIPRGSPARRTLEVVIQPPEPVRGKPRPALNLALVLDRSGSMGREKLPYAKQAAAHLVEMLSAQDRAALVVYDDQVQVLAESLPMTQPNRARLVEAVQSIRTGAATNLHEGWLTGCQQAAGFTAQGGLTRTLLLTDGLANVGVTDLEELALEARNLNNRGVSTSTFGVGADYDEHLLEAMANAGGGFYYFIDSPALIPSIFAREFGELAEVTLRDVELTLRLPAGVKAQVLGAWDVEEAPGQLRIKVGALSGGSPQALCVDLFFPAKLEDSALSVQCLLLGHGDGGQLFEDSAAVIYRLGEPEQVDAAPADQALLVRAALLRVADAVNQAHRLERKGRLDEAVELILGALRENARYLHPDEVEKYTRMAHRISTGRDMLDQKSSHNAAYMARKSRPD